MKIPLEFTRKHLEALAELSTPEGRDELSKQFCLEMILAPSENSHLPRKLNHVSEADTVKTLKDEGIGRKVGGLLALYLDEKPVENASLMAFYFSQSAINSLFSRNEIELDQAQNALIYVTDKYIGSKLAKASEFAYYLWPNTKFYLEAEVKPINISGQNYVTFADFSLESCGEKINIPEKYKSLCEALVLHFYRDDIMPSIDSALVAEMDRETNAKVDEFIAKYCS